MLLLCRVALATETVDPSDLGSLLPALVAAVQTHAWTMVAALVVGALIAFCKQGWASKWLDAKLTPAVIPWVSYALTFLSAAAADVIAGQPWPAALQAAFLAGFVPMVGHQFVIESLRGGKEIVPQKPPSRPSPPSRDIPRDAPTTPALGHIDTDPPPPPPRAA